ncbi:sugar ABC transporter substrate-binding protein [Vibrio sp. S9_S30]|uniref:sugar ABC transporter substrate-binding protein n=1 Tax=Vibrio sp. S9_S30 TaxID=2720226 RepID=UPI001680CDDA|nr:sugar ABC transporter substrate-binding protein [Vibrio sp. S9_S30]MBD1558160.1 sugar ABC transporter substrate-binding protein [Vibrio sp. S9_S30]
MSFKFSMNSIRKGFVTVSTAVLVLSFTASASAAEKDIQSITMQEVSLPASKACSTGRQYTIAYSHSLSEAQIVRQVRRFADLRAKELGCIKVLHDNTQANNLESQLNAVQSWITLNVDAIVVTPIDPKALAPLQKQAQTSGIKWLTYLGEMENSDGFVGFNHSQSGQLIANAAVDWVKANNIAKPKALVTTLTGLPLISPRWTEVERIFADNGIEIVSKQDSADQASGLRIAETVISQHPDLNIIIGLNDDSAVGAYRAVKVAGLDMNNLFIGGQDGSLEGLVATNEGQAYRGSSAIQISTLGANIVNQALNAINGNGPTSAYTPTVWASKENQAQLDSLIANYN